MVKDDVISEFNEYVNMTASELEKWLKSDESGSAGWPKDEGGDGDGDGGESVGHESGRKIVEILKANPDKDPEKYTDDQVQHMRKVASYCKRHLAQESAGNKDKGPEEVKKTKSYVSLKNWGHDFLKAQGKESGSANGGGKSNSKKQGKTEEEDEEEDGKGQDEENGAAEEEEDDKGDDGENGKKEDANEEEEEEEQEEEGKKAGDKRKKNGKQNGSNKKQQTARKTRSQQKNESEGDDDEQDGDKNGDQQDEEMGDEEEDGEGEDGDSGDKPAKKGPKKGETVSWNWGSGNPKGKVLDVKEDKATIETKRGNEVSRDGDPEDPAVVLDTGKSKAIKSAHELN